MVFSFSIEAMPKSLAILPPGARDGLPTMVFVTHPQEV
jgi:hypothetical protein